DTTMTGVDDDNEFAAWRRRRFPIVLAFGGWCGDNRFNRLMHRRLPLETLHIGANEINDKARGLIVEFFLNEGFFNLHRTHRVEHDPCFARPDQPVTIGADDATASAAGTCGQIEADIREIDDDAG